MKTLANLDGDCKIPTYSAIDELLDGGVDKGTITQFFGPPSSGKTNVALSLAVNVARKGRRVIYIDTEGGISIDRIKQISSFDFSKIASNIIVLEPTSFKEQNDNLKAIEIWFKNNNNDYDNIDLLVLDSAVALYRVDDMKSSKLNKELGKQMGILTKLARDYNIAVVLTNQIYNAFDDEGNENIKAVGGTILQYWSKIIMQLEKTDNFHERKATLIRHRSIAEGKTATFKIISKGIQ